MAIPQKSNPMAVFSTTTLEKVIMEEVRKQTSLLLESNKQLLNMCSIMADELKAIKVHLQSNAKTAIQVPVSNPVGEGNAVQKQTEIPGNSSVNSNTSETEQVKRGRGRPPVNSVNWDTVTVQFGGSDKVFAVKDVILKYCNKDDLDKQGVLFDEQLTAAFKEALDIDASVVQCIPDLTRRFFRSAMGSLILKRG